MNPVDGGWQGVRRIIDDRDTQRRSQVVDPPHVARNPPEMDDHDGSGFWRYCRSNFVGVDAERSSINIDEYDFSADAVNNFRCGCERKSWNNDLITWTEAQSFKNKVHSSGVR